MEETLHCERDGEFTLVQKSSKFTAARASGRMTARIFATVSHSAPAERHVISGDASYPVGRQ